MTKILCLSGSLRSNSSTQVVLNEVINSQSDFADEFTVYDNLGKLPHFNDNPEIPPEVMHFCEALKKADGVLFVTPEYAFGVPGTLKNALDWTVGSGEFVNKPTAVIVASTGGENAMHSLLLTLRALSANIGEKSTVQVSFIRSKIDHQGVNDYEFKESLKRVVRDLRLNIFKVKSGL
jgi:chromate reductase, NAD(P)H dehydrogenase (quinone)